MFRFSIRELMVAMLAAAMGIAWMAEHSRLRAALANAEEFRQQSKDAKERADIEEAHGKYLSGEIEKIQKQMPEWGMQIIWSCGIGPSVCKRQADGTYTSIPDNLKNEP